MTKIKLTAFTHIDQLFEIIDWCENMFGTCKYDRLGRWTGGRWWLDNDYVFVFAHGEDAVLFKLRWL